LNPRASDQESAALARLSYTGKALLRRAKRDSNPRLLVLETSVLAATPLARAYAFAYWGTVDGIAKIDGDAGSGEGCRPWRSRQAM
jgi:hypothetical protein